MDDHLETPRAGDAPSSANASFPKLPDWARTFFASPTFAFVALAVLVVLVFGESLNYAMQFYDSKIYIVDDPDIRVFDWDHVRRIFGSYYFANYNPLQRVSYMVDYALWGTNPAGYRATNFVLHWIAACFVYLFFLELTGRRFVAWTVALFFTIHPTRVESVVWLAQRKDVLAAVFGFAALWAYRRGCLTADFGDAKPDFRRVSWYVVAVVLVVCALASKSSWVPVCMVLVVLDLHERRPHIRRRAWQYAPFFAACALFTWWTIEAQFGIQKQLSVSFPLWSRFASPFRDLAVYVRFTLFPFDMYVRTAPMPFPAWQIAVGGLVAALLLVGAARDFRGKRDVFLGFSWFVLFLSPVLNFLPGILVAADRYLYVPMLGLVFPAAMLADRQPRRVAIGLTTIAGLAMWGLTWWYLPTWENDYALWDNAFRKGPRTNIVLNNMMLAARLAGETSREQAILEKLEVLLPDDVSYKYDLAAIYYRQERYAEAAKLFAESIRKKPEYATAPGNCFTVGQAFLMAGQPDQAREMFERAIRGAPKNTQYWFSLGNAHLKLNNTSETLRCWRKAVEVASDPNLANLVKARIAELEGGK